jgi:DNA-binding HxlR family transcriptional regulator
LTGCERRYYLDCIVAVVTEIRGKTEQRVTNVIRVLKRAKRPVTYDYLQEETGAHYDVLLYILSTLIEVGLVEREGAPDGPGRPRVRFSWNEDAAQAMGA